MSIPAALKEYLHFFKSSQGVAVGGTVAGALLIIFKDPALYLMDEKSCYCSSTREGNRIKNKVKKGSMVRYTGNG